MLGIFAPAKLAAEQDADNAARNNFSEQSEQTHAAFIVRGAFWRSLALVAVSIAVGYLGRRASNLLGGQPTASFITATQVVGAGMLLWGTLFVRESWTYCGVTLTERVNQWIFRSLYCIGTAMMVWSLA